MEETQARPETSIQTNDAVISRTSSELLTSAAVTPQHAGASCPTCAAAQGQGAQPSYAYVIGRIEPRFPLLSLEKELAQATRRGGGPVDLNDRQTMQKVLSEPNNRYIVRQLCWVLRVQGIETCILVPRDPADYLLLLEAYRASPNPGDLDVVIGIRGPMASPAMCNGLVVPILIFDQIYSFDRESLLGAIKPSKDTDSKKFSAAAAEMLDRIVQQSDNAGNSDSDRALNYLAVRYDQIYATAANAFAHNSSFTSIDVLPSPLSGTRKIVQVIFTFTSRETDVTSKYFVRVDVTEEFPFLVTKMSPYYDR
ncbi:MAG TPA: hypothetical protein VN861_18985 [Candidatus Acidoferrales bacterium]|nr:hypothetical protein [Candidatus Acidoferrales bacterium]